MVAKVMIAEDNIALVSCYQNLLSKDENVRIAGFAQDGETAIKMYQEINPDILLLDLGLPTKDGIEVINTLTEYEKENKKCNIVVISGDTMLRQNLYNTKKVFRIIPKPATDELLLSTVKQIKSELEVQSFPEALLHDILTSMALKPYSKSCKLLKDIIKLVYYDPDLLDNMMVIYKRMGIKYSCSDKKIQSRLRSCIDTVNRSVSQAVFNSIFYMYGDDFYKYLTPKNFVSGIVTYLKKV